RPKPMADAHSDDHQARRYVVVGGANGIGLQFSRLAMAAGARVSVLDNNVPALEALAAEQPDCPTFSCDVRDDSSVRDAMTKAAEALGGAIEGLIYCVGVDLQQAFS